jgi:hypothetical protein
MELYDHWNEQGTARTLLRSIAIGLGVIEPPTRKGSTPPEEIAMMVQNPKTFGGAAFPISELPEWMKISLAKQEL